MQKDTVSPSPTAETLQQFLERIFCEIPHIDSMFLLSAGGEIIAHAANDKICENLPALTMELLRFAAGAAASLHQGAPQYLLLKNENGYLMAAALAGAHIFVILGREHIRPDVLQYSAQWIARKLAALL